MEDGAVLAEYRYTPNGNVHEKLYYDKGVLKILEKRRI